MSFAGLFRRMPTQPTVECVRIKRVYWRAKKQQEKPEEIEAHFSIRSVSVLRQHDWFGCSTAYRLFYGIRLPCEFRTRWWINLTKTHKENFFIGFAVCGETRRRTNAARLSISAPEIRSKFTLPVSAYGRKVLVRALASRNTRINSFHLTKLSLVFLSVFHFISHQVTLWFDCVTCEMRLMYCFYNEL